MAYLNENYLKLQAGYLFPEIARRVKEFCDANPDAAGEIIRCGIGDVTEPLPSGGGRRRCTRRSMSSSHRETFRGYGHEQGYEFLRDENRATRLPRPRDRNRGRRDLSLRRIEARLRLHPRYSRRPEQDRDHRSGLSGLRRYQRDGGAHRARRTRTAAMKGSSICRAERRTALSPSRRPRMLIWFTFAFRTIRPAQWRHARN